MTTIETVDNSRYLANATKIKWHGFFSGGWFFLPIMFIYFKKTGISYAEFGLIFSSINIAKLICEVPSGTFADRVGRKYAMALGSLCLFFCFLFWGLGNTLWAFLIGGAFRGVADALMSGSDSALLFDSLKVNRQEAQFSKHYGKKWEYLCYGFASSALASVIIIPFGEIWLFFASAFSMIVAFAFALAIYEPPIHKHLQEGSISQHVSTASKFIFSHEIVLSLFLGTIAILTGIQIYFQYLQFLLKDIGVRQEHFGYLYAAFTLISGFSAARAHTIESKIGKINSLWLIFLSLVIACFFSGLSKGLLLTLCFILLIEFNFGFSSTLLNTFFQKYVESHHRATVISLRQFAFGVMMTTTAPIFGIIADNFGFRIMLITLGAFLLIAAGLPFLHVTRKLATEGS